MYKLTTKNGTYFFTILEDVFNYIDSFDEIILKTNDDYVKLTYIVKEGKEK